MAWQQVFDPRNRDAGTYTSPSIGVDPTTTLAARAILTPQDRTDATLIIRIAIEGSYDASGTSWHGIASVVWNGGTDEDGNPLGPPEFRLSPPPSGIRRVRAVIDLNKRVQIGAETDVY